MNSLDFVQRYSAPADPAPCRVTEIPTSNGVPMAEATCSEHGTGLAALDVEHWLSNWAVAHMRRMHGVADAIVPVYRLDGTVERVGGQR